MAYPTIPRDLLRKAENENFPLIGLRAVVEVRAHLDEIERAAIVKARELGASTTDIGEALGITRQAAYQRLKNLPGGEPDGKHVVVLPDETEAPEPTG